MPIAPTARLQPFIGMMQHPARKSIAASDVAIVVAHPDDETIACGALLRRLKGVLLVVVTDGAPRNLYDARGHGFADAEDYAAARAKELSNACLSAALHRVIQFDVPDQEAAFNLDLISSRLFQIFREQRIGVVLTLAYEGGHPDHDATAFAVHHAAQATRHNVGILEMPLYRARAGGELRQSFVPYAGRQPIVCTLNSDERAFKRRLIALYATQRNVLAGFSIDREQFRAAPHYNFAKPPNGGRVLYDRHEWGIRSDEWLQQACASLKAEALI